FAYAVAHLGLGLGSLRLVSAAFAVASLPLIALLGRRLAGRSAALIATALVAGSWVFLFHGVYARMYSLFLFLSLLSFVLLLRALDRGTWKSWALWGCTILLAVASHPYGALVLAAQGAFVLGAHRERLRQAVIAFGAVAVVGVPFWLTDLVLAGRFDVGVGGPGGQVRRTGRAATGPSSAARGRSSRICGRRPVTSAPAAGPSSSSCWCWR